MTSRHVKINGVFLSVLMVVSMVAMGAIGAAGATAPTEEVDASIGDASDLSQAAVGQAGDQVQAQQDHDPSAVAVEDELERRFAEAGDEPVQVIVTLEGTSVSSNLDQATAIDRLQSHAEATQRPLLETVDSLEGAEVLNTMWLANKVLIEADSQDVLEEVRSVPGVERLSDNPTVQAIPDDYGAGAEKATSVTNPEDSHLTYGLDMINASEAWQETEGEGSTVVILDTGVDPDHQDITLSEFVEFDPQTGDPDPSVAPYDDDGHGTHTSSTATGNNVGETAIGVAPEAELMVGKTLDAGVGSAFGTASAMEWFIDNHDVDVVSMSLGFNSASEEFVEPSYNARQMGVSVVGSVGNSGQGTSSTPGNTWDEISAGAVDENAEPSDFGLSGGTGGELIDVDSHWGDAALSHWPEEFYVPTVAAPGSAVLGAQQGTTDGYVEFSGTSMSAPHIAGTIALMKSAGAVDDSEREPERILESTAWKPEDWPGAPAGERDDRYGSGIIDAAAALEEVSLPVPEYDLGDVDESGEVGVDDVVKTQQHIAGIPVEGFNANLADIDRSGTADDPDVDVGDLITIHRKVLGMTDPGEATIENVNLDTDQVDVGDTFNVTASIANGGDEGAIQYLNVTFDGADEPSGQTVADIAPDTTTTDVTVEVTADQAAGNGTAFTVSTDDSSATGSIDVMGSYFNVTSFDAPDETHEAESPMSVNATIANEGNQKATQTVEYTFDGSVGDSTTVTLDGGENETVEFTYDAAGHHEGGTYDHGVATEDDEWTQPVTILESNFEVANLQAPETVFLEESYEVEATIENTGDVPGEQQVEYDLVAGADVGVIDADLESGFDYADVLESNLPDGYEIDVLTPSEAVDNVDDYDTFVAYRFDTTSNAEDFLDAIDDQGVVYLDNWGYLTNPYSDSIERLSYATGDPGSWDRASGSGPDFGFTLEQDHEIFTDVGDVGETVHMYEQSTGYHFTFDDYSGEVLAQTNDAGTDQGPGVGVNEDKNQVLLALGGGIQFGDPAGYSDEAHTLMANAVSYLSTGVAVGEQSQSVAGDQSTTVTLDSTSNVALDPGENTTVTFSNTAQDVTLGVAEHIVSSEDDSAAQTTTIDTERGHVEGTVTSDRTGEPIEGATVEVDVADPNQDNTATTDENGEYVIEDVPIGTHDVTVSADGYQDHSAEITVPENDAVEHDAALKEFTGSISGQVTASDTGEPVSDATVMLEDDKGQTTELGVDENGEYTFEDLYQGTYWVDVADAGDDFEDIIHLEAGEELTGVDFTVDPVPGTIEATVQDVNGTVLSGVTVRTADGEYQNQTNDNGEVVLDDVDRGTYTVEAIDDEWGESGLYFVDVSAGETSELTITMGVHFSVSNLEAPAQADPGDNITVTADVTNEGDFVFEDSVTYYGPNATTLPQKDLELQGGETETVEFSYQIPEDTPVGQYEHIVQSHDYQSANITIGDYYGVDIEDQQYEGETDSVEVASASTISDYVVAIHDGTDASGDVLGTSDVIDANTYVEDLEIALDESMNESRNVAAVLHEPGQEGSVGDPITDDDGNQVVDTAAVEIVEVQGQLTLEDQALGTDGDGNAVVYVDELESELVTKGVSDPSQDMVALHEGDASGPVVDYAPISEAENGELTLHNPGEATPGDYTVEIYAPQDAPQDAPDESVNGGNSNADSDGVDTAGQVAPADVTVHDDLRSAEGQVEVVVHLESAPKDSLTADESTNVDVLQSHADRTQQEFLDEAERLDSVEALNSAWIVNSVLLSVDADRIDRLAAMPNVQAIYPNQGLLEVPEPTATDVEPDDHGATTYGLSQINAPAVWEQYGATGENVDVAVIDTGVDGSHPDLELAEWAEFDDTGNRTGSSPHDPNGHGTHTSGTVAGGMASGLQGQPHFGVAPDADLIGIKAYNDTTGFLPLFATVSGMQWAAQNQSADVVSMSFGGTPGGFHIEGQRNLRAAGVVAVSSAGNDGVGTTGEPAASYDTLSVGATDANQGIATFSSGMSIHVPSVWNEGESLGAPSEHPWVGDEVEIPDHWPREFVSPDVSAPGVSVTSSYPTAAGSYAQISGTSMAAPHVAGTVALMLSASEDDHSVDEIHNVFEETAFKPADAPDEQDIRYGHGIVDALEATERLVDDASGTVEGTVTDEDGDPVPGVTVQTDGEVADTTDENGEYTLHLGTGTYNVTADAFGYADEAAGVTVEDGNATTQNFTLADEVTAEVLSDAPVYAEYGGEFNASIDVRNVEEYTIDLTDDSDVTADDVTVTFDGNEVTLGETMTDVRSDDGLLPASDGGVPVTVDVADGDYEEGDRIELEYTFSGPGGEVTNTTTTDLTEELDPAVFELSGLDVPGALELGNALPASVTVTNTGQQSAEKQVQHVLDTPAGLLSLPPVAMELDPHESDQYQVSATGLESFLAPGVTIEAGFQTGEGLAGDNATVDDTSLGPIDIFDTAPDLAQPRDAAETATAFEADVGIDDQTVTDGEVTVSTATLLDGANDDTEFVVAIHDGDEIVGTSATLTGANEDVTVAVENVTDTTDVTATLHFADDSSNGVGEAIQRFDAGEFGPVSDDATLSTTETASIVAPAGIADVPSIVA